MKDNNPGAALILHWQYEHQKSIQELARRIGVRGTSIHEWRAQGKIPMRHWKKILEVTGLDLRKQIVC